MSSDEDGELIAAGSAAADIYAFAWDLDTDHASWGPLAHEVLGPLPESGRYPGLRHMIHPEDLPDLEARLRNARDSDGRVFGLWRLQSTDAKLRWIRLRGRIAPNGSAPPILLRGIILDTNERRISELEARRKLYEYREVLNCLPDRVWSKDLAGRFTTVNRAFTDFAGVPLEQIIGKTSAEFLPASMVEKSEEEDANIIAEGVSARTERAMVSRGRAYQFEVLKSPLRDASGRIIGVTGLTHDVTQRHALQESLAKALREQETLLATCPTGICIVRNRVIERCNPAAAAMLGYRVEELMGQSTRILYPDENAWAEMMRHLYPDAQDGHVHSREVEFARKDGSRVWILLISHILDSASKYGVSTWVDISQQKKLSQAMADARDAAEAANRAKSNFLATMSHEIRTPMYGVLGMLELLEATKLDDGQRETLQVVRDSANALLGLIDGVLDFSKIEAGQLAINAVPFDLRQVASQCVMLYHESAAKRGLGLKADIDAALPPSLIGDSLRIRQIINNLLSNAIKFTSRGEVALAIRCVAVEGEAQRLAISVTDTGIGIDEATQSRLFQPFVQADSGTTRRFGGTGLGLAICKQLTDAMGGTLEMKSAPGAGATVTLQLTLPVGNIPQPDERPLSVVPAQAGAPAARQRLLVAEDHPVNLRMLARQLEQLGYDADLATDGIEALRLWRAGHYAALISDCHMPDMDGYELTREIRALEAATGATKPIPIIACTASALAEEGEQCLAAGMNDVMVKPVAMATLREHLTQWLPDINGARLE
ncbi:MAG: PAS domain S-box protein [Betaproteobacteria bacterium]|nr:PAS domain S-box protein [Betaproteobacteria bacterium]